MKFFNNSSNLPNSFISTVSAGLMFSLIQTANAQDADRLSTESIVGITVGASAALCATVACCLCLYRKATGEHKYQSLENNTCDTAAECLRIATFCRL